MFLGWQKHDWSRWDGHRGYREQKIEDNAALRVPLHQIKKTDTQYTAAAYREMNDLHRSDRFSCSSCFFFSLSFSLSRGVFLVFSPPHRRRSNMLVIEAPLLWNPVILQQCKAQPAHRVRSKSEVRAQLNQAAFVLSVNLRCTLSTTTECLLCLLHLCEQTPSLPCKLACMNEQWLSAFVRLPFVLRGSKAKLFMIGVLLPHPQPPCCLFSLPIFSLVFWASFRST